MNKKQPSYKKLSSKFFTPFVRTSLWKGDDHLLWVERAMIQERYKRFYYDDIQALVVVKNNNQHIWSFIWGAFAVLFGVVALTVSGTPYASSVFTGLFVSLLCINLMMGPCCNTYLKTRVQQEHIKHLVRLRKASRILDQIKKLVEEKQGFYSPQNVPRAEPSEMQQAQMSPVPESSVAQNTEQPVDEPESVYAALHWALYGLLGLVGMIKCSQYWLQSTTLSILELFSLAVLLILCIAALVRQRGNKKHRTLITFDWIALVLVVLQCIAAYIIYTIAAVQNPVMAYNIWILLKTFVSMLNEGNPVITGLVFGFGLVSLAVGLCGMTILIKHKK